MTNVPANRLIDQLIRSVSPGDGEEQADGDLLTRFVEHSDKAAINALVRRHGTMVWGVCVRALHNQHDAEDAFQATFLVLVRKAATVIPREMVGNWLYGVARQVTLQARRVIARRRAREAQVIDLPDTPVAQPRVSPDLRSVLDEELVLLPSIYRAVVVLCDLEGRTRKEVAHHLGVPEGTVGGRLARARTMLGKRLARRGVTASGPLLGTTLASQATAAPVPAAVVSSTITVIASLAAAEQAATVAVSPTVAELVSGVTKAMFMTKLKALTIIALLSALTLGGVGTGIRLLGGSDALARQKTTPAVEGPTNGPMAGARDKGVDDLQGEWRVVEWQEEGGKAKDLKGKRLVIKGDEITTIQAQLGLADKLSFKLAPGKSPKEIDLTALNGLTKGMTHPGIYEIEGRRLRICYGMKVRPKEFETTPVSGLVMVTLERDGKGEKEVSTAWGQEVGGLQAGLGFRAGQNPVYRSGDTVQLVVRLRNVGKQPTQYRYPSTYFAVSPPSVRDDKGQWVVLKKVVSSEKPRLVTRELAPGADVELGDVTIELVQKLKAGMFGLDGTGRFVIQYEKIEGAIGGGDRKSDVLPDATLATGQLEVEVREANDKAPAEGRAAASDPEPTFLKQPQQAKVNVAASPKFNDRVFVYRAEPLSGTIVGHHNATKEIVLDVGARDGVRFGHAFQISPPGSTECVGVAKVMELDANRCVAKVVSLDQGHAAKSLKGMTAACTAPKPEKGKADVERRVGKNVWQTESLENKLIRELLEKDGESRILILQEN